MSVPGVLCINDLKGLLAGFGLFLFLCVEVVASEMPSPEFIKGMSYEFDGRATMHAITANMAKRFDEGEMNTYWSSYHRLEEFSRPRYENSEGVGYRVAWQDLGFDQGKGHKLVAGLHDALGYREFA